MTKPKNRGPAVATVPRAACDASESSTAFGSSPRSGSGTFNAESSSSRVARAPTWRSGSVSRNSTAWRRATSSSDSSTIFMARLYYSKQYNWTMTIWSPKLEQSEGPLYQRIADLLQRDVDSGALLPGSRLPTQRELARKLGVTVVTVTRAYSEAAERGLLESTVGRGSFVRERREEVAVIDLSTNVIQGGVPLMSAALAARIGAAMTMPYGIGGGSERHRAAGAAWLQRTRPDAQAARVIVTAGAQQGILL